MEHDAAPVAESVQRPARLKGGAATVGAALAGDAAGEPLSNPKRSLPPQPARSAVQIRIGMVAMREFIGCRCGKGEPALTMVSRRLRSCQDANPLVHFTGLAAL